MSKIFQICLAFVFAGTIVIHADFLNPSNNGTYFRVNNVQANLVLDSNGTNVYLKPLNNNWFSQYWTWEDTFLTNIQSGQVLENTAFGFIKMNSKNGGNYQKWTKIINGSDTRIQNIGSTKFLDVVQSNLFLSRATNTQNPSWSFITAPIYYLQYGSDNVYLTQYSATFGANVNPNNIRFDSLSNSNAQKWYLLDSGDGYFQIVNFAVKSALHCGSINKLLLASLNYNTDCQKWTSDGSYFKNKAFPWVYLSSINGKPGVSDSTNSWTMQLV